MVTKRTLAARSPRRGDQLLVGLDQRLVEDLAEGRRDLSPGSLDVGGDRRRRVDDLVLEAGVELHVPGLVDLLGGEEGRLLLGAVGADQAGELGRDPLLGDHQLRPGPSR